MKTTLRASFLGAVAFRKAFLLGAARGAHDNARTAGQVLLGAERRYRAALDELAEKRARWLEFNTALMRANAKRSRR